MAARTEILTTQTMARLDSVTPVRRGSASVFEVILSVDKGHYYKQPSDHVLSTVHPTINLCARAIPRLPDCYNKGNHSPLPHSARDDQRGSSLFETRLEEGLWHFGRISFCRVDRLSWRQS